MGTPHNDAKPGEIAEKILLPGDPLRAKFIAENFLENAVCYNQVRGMYGYTGFYKGERVSVQGTGMGMPSMHIYASELMQVYGVQKLIRVGTCGSMQKDIHLRDVVIAMAASTDSGINKDRFGNISFAPTASFQLVKSAWEKAQEKNLHAIVSNVFTSDKFYDDNGDTKHELLASYGIAAVEMETCELYTLALKYGVEALTMLTVSDSVLTGESCSAKERQETFNDMIEIALEI